MESIILNKAKLYAVRIVNAHRYLVDTHHEYKMSDQLLRSGTAVQALASEAQYAQSKPDFISKMSIALKEANESRNWLELLHTTGYIPDNAYNSIINDANEIVVTLIKIIRTSKRNGEKDTR